jgi:hypothetical protein
MIRIKFYKVKDARLFLYLRGTARRHFPGPFGVSGFEPCAIIDIVILRICEEHGGCGVNGTL